MIKYALDLSLRLHALFDVAVGERNPWVDNTELTALARCSSLRFECFTGSKMEEDPRHEARVQIGNLRALWPLVLILVEPDIDSN